MRRFASLAVVLALIAAFVLGGCSDDDDGAGSTTTTAAASGDTSGGDDGDETSTTGSKDDEDDDTGDGPVEVSDEARPYVDAMVESLESDSDDDLPLTDDQKECIGSRFVDVIGVDRFQEAGLDPEDLSSDDSMEFTDLELDEDEGNRLYDSFEACGVDLREAMMASLGGDDEVSPAMRGCFESAFSGDNLRRLMVATMIGGDAAIEDDPELEAMMGALMGCAFMGMGEQMEDTSTSTTGQ